MLSEYIHAALRRANYKQFDDGTWFAETPEFQGVWANSSTVEDCRHELRGVLEAWLILKIRDNDPIPIIDRIEIKVQEEAVA